MKKLIGYLRLNFFIISLIGSILLGSMTIISCQNSSPAEDKTSQNVTITHHGVGVIEAIDKEKRKVKINHKAIKDFMEAMTMDFYVEEPSLLDNIKVGDKVNFTLKYESGIEKIVDLTKIE